MCHKNPKYLIVCLANLQNTFIFDIPHSTARSAFGLPDQLRNLLTIGCYCISVYQQYCSCWLAVNDPMYKKLHYIACFLLFCNTAFSQTVSDREKPSVKLPVTAVETPTTVVLPKKEYPVDQKVAPEIIYVINDQPVSREEYQQSVNKKKIN